MTMGTAFANTDLLVVNVISVKRDLREANVMNVSQISLVTIAMNANQAISITHCVKVTNCFLVICRLNRLFYLHIYLRSPYSVLLDVLYRLRDCLT